MSDYNIERLQRAQTSAAMATLNVCSAECLQRADHNWIPWHYEMNFTMRLSLHVPGQRYPVTLTTYTLNVVADVEFFPLHFRGKSLILSISGTENVLQQRS